jgi:hypothetical protein
VDQPLQRNELINYRPYREQLRPAGVSALAGSGGIPNPSNQVVQVTNSTTERSFIVLSSRISVAGFFN